MKIKIRMFIASSILLLISMPLCAQVIVTLYSTQTDHKKLGTVTFEKKSSGLVITPALTGLTPGMHGMHLHDQASCEKNGMAAGSHFDPQHTGKHLGPDNVKGHLGDLPALIVDKNGVAKKELFVKRLQESDLYGHALIIHAGGDNYSDSPKPLGGGGDRIACGVIKK